jgi:hypothetical protein
MKILQDLKTLGIILLFGIIVGGIGWGISTLSTLGEKVTPTPMPTPTPFPTGKAEATLPITTAQAYGIAVGIALIIGLILWKPKILHAPGGYIKEIGTAKPWGKVMLIGIPLGIILACGVIRYLYKLENPTPNATPTLTAIITSAATPTLPPIAIEAPVIADTLTPTLMPTATPIPIWVAARSYSATSPEILVPADGLVCKGGITFQINGDSLNVSFLRVSYSINLNDPLFVSGSKWAVFIPKNRWGVTYFDLTNNIGQSKQITESGWIIDNRGCQIINSP